MLQLLFSAICVAYLNAIAANAQVQVDQVQLPYAGFKALEPWIDAETMEYHYNTHYENYVVNLNDAVRNATSHDINVNATDLTSLIKSVGSLPAPLNNTVRHQGGGAWNHALYFKQLAPANNPATGLGDAAVISQPLRDAVMQSYGTVEAMVTELKQAAMGVFGSGWAWLCYTGNSTAPGSSGNLTITTTPNQDNPLMGSLPGAPPVKAAGCTPILGIDVWEHAYYLKHGPKRAEYLNDFWKVLSWQAVSSNYANAAAGNVQNIVA